MSDENSVSLPTRVECPAARDPAVRLFIGAAMAIAAGIWCLTDLREPPEAWDMKHINEVAGFLLNNRGPYLFFPVGAILAVIATLYLRRVLVVDDEGIGFVGKKKTPWSDVDSLDASKLESKGIIVLRCTDGRQIKLDSWKLQNFRNMVALVEMKVKKIET